MKTALRKRFSAAVALLLAFLLVFVALILSVLPVFAATKTVDSEKALSQAIEASYGADDPCVIEIGASFAISGPICVEGAQIILKSAEGENFVLSKKATCTYLFEICDDAELTLQDITLTGSTTQTQEMIKNQGVLILGEGSCIQNNSSACAGAITNLSGGSLTINGGTLSGNTSAKKGGAIYAYSGSTVSLLNGSVKNNTASVAGGGIYLEKGAILEVAGGMVSGNTAPAGSGLFCAGNLSFQGGVLEGLSFCGSDWKFSVGSVPDASSFVLESLYANESTQISNPTLPYPIASVDQQSGPIERKSILAAFSTKMDGLFIDLSQDGASLFLTDADPSKQETDADKKDDDTKDDDTKDGNTKNDENKTNNPPILPAIQGIVEGALQSGGDADNQLVLPVNAYLVLPRKLNVRLAPSTSSTIAGSLARGERIDVLSYEDGWAHILFGEADAYVMALYLTPVSTSHQVTASLLNVRAQASLDASKIGLLPFGSTVLVLNETDGWAEIFYHGQTAYVSLEYMQAIESAMP